MRVSRRVADSRLEVVFDLMYYLPATFEALRTGVVDEAQARLIAELTRGLEPEARWQAEEWILAQIADECLTWAQIRRRLARKVV